jgi:hypothetical protein
MIACRPIDLFASAELAQGVVGFVGDRAMLENKATLGGIDLRRAEELVVADHGRGRLSLLRTRFDPTAVEEAFARLSQAPVVRRVERLVDPSGVPFPDMIELRGVLRGAPATLALLGHEALVLESGTLGRIRASELFAAGRLHRALPALDAPPLEALPREFREAPALFTAVGPFDSEQAGAFGGLGAHANAVAMFARIQSTPIATQLVCRLRILCPFSSDAAVEAAARRLTTWLEMFESSLIGRTLGLRPLSPVRVLGDRAGLTAETGYGLAGVLRGVRAVTVASVEELLRTPPQWTPKTPPDSGSSGPQ